MRYAKNILLFSSLFWGLGATGCGGHVPDSRGATRGEGTIPIGKISTRPVPPAQVTALCADGTTQIGTVASDGTVLLPPLPYGKTVLLVVPQSGEFEVVEKQRRRQGPPTCLHQHQPASQGLFGARWRRRDRVAQREGPAGRQNLSDQGHGAWQKRCQP